MHMNPAELNRFEDFVFAILASPDEKEARTIFLEALCALVPRAIAIAPMCKKAGGEALEFFDNPVDGAEEVALTDEELALVRFLFRTLSFREKSAALPPDGPSDEPSPGASPAPALSRQQQQVYELLVTGCCVKEISSALNISEATVKYHSKNIYALFGVDSKARLIARSREHSF